MYKTDAKCDKSQNLVEVVTKVSQMILLSDPLKPSGQVYIDYGNPRSPRFLCDAKDPGAFDAIAERYFSLIDILMGDMVSRIREADLHNRITVSMNLDEASAHKRLAATDELTALLQEADASQQSIEAYHKAE